MSAGPTETAPVEADALEQRLLSELRVMLGKVIGEDYIADVEIGLDTSFETDLEVESIEFVALAEELKGRYGERVDFVAWMGRMEVDEIMAMTVGTLVRFVAGALREAEAHG